MGRKLEFKVGQMWLCKSTWVKYVVKEIFPDGEVLIRYGCDCHGFEHKYKDKKLVKIDKRFSDDRKLREKVN